MSADSVTPYSSMRITRALLIVEAVFVSSLGLYMLILGFTHEEKEIAPLAGVIAFAFIGGAALYALSWGIANEKRWATSPAIFANLIALGVAKYQFEAGLYGLAIPMVLVALTIIFNSIKIIRASA
jgi:hypothetical protein